MDRLKDKLKELFEDHKLKIVVGLLLLIGGLMVTLFILIGQRDNSQNMSTPTNVNQNLSSHNFKRSGSNPQSNHFQSTFIDIEGAVKRPGVYQFTNNMRVDDAVNLAGGLNRSADRKHINLAKKLEDQQTVYIPIKGEIKGLPAGSGDSPSSSASSDSGSDSGSSDKVNLNTADVKQLESINGVGEKRAEKVLDYRKSHGKFKQISDLKNVSGIGDKFLSNIKGHVTL